MSVCASGFLQAWKADAKVAEEAGSDVALLWELW